MKFYSPNNINNSISFYEADIQDKSLIDTIFEENPNIHTCIHLAAKISVSDSIKNPIDTMNVNVNGTYNMLVASVNNDIKNFVFASSAVCFMEIQPMFLLKRQKIVIPFLLME